MVFVVARLFERVERDLENKRPSSTRFGWHSDEKKQYLRRFCNEHPLDYYITGAKRLFLSLPVVDQDRAKPTVTLSGPKAE